MKKVYRKILITMVALISAFAFISVTKANYIVNADWSITYRGGTSWDPPTSVSVEDTMGETITFNVDRDEDTVTITINGTTQVTATKSSPYTYTCIGDCTVTRNGSTVVITDVVPTTITVSYNLDGGTAATTISNQTVNVDSACMLSAVVPTKTDKKFAGWSDGNNVYQAGATYYVGKSNVTLIATYVDKDTLTLDTTGTQTFSYNGESHPYVYAGTNSDKTTFTYQYYIDDTWVSTAPTNAGTYDVKVIGASTNDYKASETTITGGIVINKSNIIITQPQGYTSIASWEQGSEPANHSKVAVNYHVYFDTTDNPKKELTTYTATYGFKGESDIAYKSDIPKYMGQYYAKVSIAGTDNYNGLNNIDLGYFYVNEYTTKATIKKATNGTVSCTQEEYASDYDGIFEAVSISSDADTVVTCYHTNDALLLKASPANGYLFTGWYDENDDLISTDNPFYLEVKENMTINPVFALKGKVTFVVAETITGTIDAINGYIGKDIILPNSSSLTVSGKVLKGFNDQEDLKGTTYLCSSYYTIASEEDKLYPVFVDDKYIVLSISSTTDATSVKSDGKTFRTSGDYLFKEGKSFTVKYKLEANPGFVEAQISFFQERTFNGIPSNTSDYFYISKVAITKDSPFVVTDQFECSTSISYDENNTQDTFIFSSSTSLLSTDKNIGFIEVTYTAYEDIEDNGIYLFGIDSSKFAATDEDGNEVALRFKDDVYYAKFYVKTETKIEFNALYDGYMYDTTSAVMEYFYPRVLYKDSDGNYKYVDEDNYVTYENIVTDIMTTAYFYNGTAKQDNTTLRSSAPVYVGDYIYKVTWAGNDIYDACEGTQQFTITQAAVYIDLTYIDYKSAYVTTSGIWGSDASSFSFGYKVTANCGFTLTDAGDTAEEDERYIVEITGNVTGSPVVDWDDFEDSSNDDILTAQYSWNTLSLTGVTSLIYIMDIDGYTEDSLMRSHVSLQTADMATDKAAMEANFTLSTDTLPINVSDTPATTTPSKVVNYKYYYKSVWGFDTQSLDVTTLISGLEYYDLKGVCNIAWYKVNDVNSYVHYDPTSLATFTTSYVFGTDVNSTPFNLINDKRCVFLYWEYIEYTYDLYWTLDNDNALAENDSYIYSASYTLKRGDAIPFPEFETNWFTTNEDGWFYNKTNPVTYTSLTAKEDKTLYAIFIVNNELVGDVNADTFVNLTDVIQYRKAYLGDPKFKVIYSDYLSGSRFNSSSVTNYGNSNADVISMWTSINKETADYDITSIFDDEDLLALFFVGRSNVNYDDDEKTDLTDIVALRQSLVSGFDYAVFTKGGNELVEFVSLFTLVNTSVTYESKTYKTSYATGHDSLIEIFKYKNIPIYGKAESHENEPITGDTYLFKYNGHIKNGESLYSVYYYETATSAHPEDTTIDQDDFEVEEYGIEKGSILKVFTVSDVTYFYFDFTDIGTFSYIPCGMIFIYGNNDYADYGYVITSNGL